jgi:hypothetical protein
MTTTSSDHKIMDVLNFCRPTLDWISGCAPVAVELIPIEHLENIKTLEKLGIVIRRNSRTLEVAKQRLRRVLESEAKN